VSFARIEKRRAAGGWVVVCFLCCFCVCGKKKKRGGGGGGGGGRKAEVVLAGLPSAGLPSKAEGQPEPRGSQSSPPLSPGHRHAHGRGPRGSRGEIR
jgi:hypothetical protein